MTMFYRLSLAFTHFQICDKVIASSFVRNFDEMITNFTIFDLIKNVSFIKSANGFISSTGTTHIDIFLWMSIFERFLCRVNDTLIDQFNFMIFWISWDSIKFYSIPNQKTQKIVLTYNFSAELALATLKLINYLVTYNTILTWLKT